MKMRKNSMRLFTIMRESFVDEASVTLDEGLEKDGLKIGQTEESPGSEEELVEDSLKRRRGTCKIESYSFVISVIHLYHSFLELSALNAEPIKRLR